MGVPFQVLADFKGKTVVLTTIKWGREFEEDLNKEEVEVEILNQEVGEAESKLRRRSAKYSVANEK